MSTQSKIELKKSYDHKEVEPKWTEEWLREKIFKVQIHENTEKFSISLPPPNVTGELHMGHALGGTIQDLLIRYHRMLGKDVHWQIGTDHAGIGTQIVVEKQLKATEKINRYDLGREKFIERTQAWKEEYGGKILEQMKQLGFSPDYERSRYTMDEHYADAVKRAFIKYFNEGLIYKGKRIVNWCPKCLTSLSDLEIDKEAGKKKLYEIKYILSGTNNYLVVATTRPETMFGDSAVAINPKDDRYKEIIDRINSGESVYLRIAISNREIPVILDEHVKTDFGTGALKVTPAHDPNDFEIGNRHSLPRILMMDEQARLLANDDIPESLRGLDRYEARKQVLEMLEAEDLLVKVSEYDQEKDLHDRCGTEIEPYLSDQWYLRMTELAKLALKTVSGDKRTKFIPERYSEPFSAWLENIQDWCISRQIWWGHRIPVYYYRDGEEIKYLAAESEEEARKKIGAGFNGNLDQDEDVLDTWFSSALWPFETLKGSSPEDEKIFKAFYPTSVLATAREIINLWVSRMIFSSEYFEGMQPFSDVLIHPVVQTPDGKRMSKSKGNAINPLDLVELYGADASRMWYASVGVLGHQDVRFPGQQDKKTRAWSSETIEQYRKFANKLYNAAKFVMMQLDEDSGFKPSSVSEILESESLTMADKWTLSKFNRLLSELKNDYHNYDLGAVQKKIYEFIWFDFCDWYIEMSKLQLSLNEKQIQQNTRSILFYVLESSLRAVQPIMPYITEEIWQVLRTNYDFSEIEKDTLNSHLEERYKKHISFAKYPESHEAALAFQSSEMDTVISLIQNLRNSRQSLSISWSDEFEIFIADDEGVDSREMSPKLQAIKNGENYIFKIAKLSKINYQKPSNTKGHNLSLVSGLRVFIPLEGLVDIEKLKAALEKKISKVEKDLAVLESMLQSQNFMDNASPEKIQESKNNCKKFLALKEAYLSEISSIA
jgi:valyl-tRNA synthetase